MARGEMIRFMAEIGAQHPEQIKDFDRGCRFADKLNGYKTGKGAIQFPHDQDIPLDLIAEIAKRSYENNATQ